MANMCYEEVLDSVFFKTYKTTVNDNIVRVARKLYASDDDVYKTALRTLNKRNDWNNMRIGEEIRYLDKDVVQKVLWN